MLNVFVISDLGPALTVYVTCICCLSVAILQNVTFPSLQPWEMRANHNPAVRQHCVQPDHLAKPAWPQQAGAGGHGGPPVLSLGQGAVLPPPTNLPMLCLCPCLHNPRGPSSTLSQFMPSSSGWLRRVDEQVWFPMAGQPCLSHLSRGWRPQQAVRRGD